MLLQSETIKRTEIHPVLQTIAFVSFFRPNPHIHGFKCKDQCATRSRFQVQDAGL